MTTLKYSFILVLLISLFVLRYPRQLTATDGNVQLLNQFLSSTIAENHFDMEDWLKVHEFYSTGTYTYDKDQFDILSNLEFRPITTDRPVIFFISESKHLYSQQILVLKEEQSAFFNQFEHEEADILFDNDGVEIIYQPSLQVLKILIAKPVDQLPRYNGLMAFHENDPLLQGKVWLTQATLKLPKNYKLPF